MPRAARPSSNNKYSRRRPRRRDALFRRLALTTKAFFKANMPTGREFINNNNKKGIIYIRSKPSNIVNIINKDKDKEEEDKYKQK